MPPLTSTPSKEPNRDEQQNDGRSISLKRIDLKRGVASGWIETGLTPAVLARALNGVLPGDLAVVSLEEG